MSEKYYAETERSKVWWNIVSFNFCYLNVGKKKCDAAKARMGSTTCRSKYPLTAQVHTLVDVVVVLCSSGRSTEW